MTEVLSETQVAGVPFELEAAGLEIVAPEHRIMLGAAERFAAQFGDGTAQTADTLQQVFGTPQPNHMPAPCGWGSVNPAEGLRNNYWWGGDKKNGGGK